MRIPSPSALKIGTDIVATHRFLQPPTVSKTISSIQPKQTHLQRLTNRFLHPLEIKELTRRFPEWHQIITTNTSQINKSDNHQQTAKLINWLAGRWAAKEAAKKAWGADLLSFKDLRTEVMENTGEVEIICRNFSPPSPSTSPSLLNGDGNDQQEDQALEQSAKLSISHDGGYAIAVVLAAPLDGRIVRELRDRKEVAERAVQEGGGRSYGG